MPTYKDNGKSATIFIFNHLIARFGVPKAIVMDHGIHFHNFMMIELSAELDLHHDSSTPYYPQENGQVEAVNKFLTNMIKHIVDIHRENLHNMLFPVLWAYHTTAKTSTGFTPFLLVYCLKAVFTIDDEIPSLKLFIELLPYTSIEEENFLYLASLDEARREAALASEAHKKWVKVEFDQSVNPHLYAKGDLVLVYDQAHDKLGVDKFEPMWHGPYIVKHVLAKGDYKLLIMMVLIWESPGMAIT